MNVHMLQFNTKVKKNRTGKVVVISRAEHRANKSLHSLLKKCNKS